MSLVLNSKNVMQPELRGIHHVSALSAHIQRSHNLYTCVLGLLPLIKTVNHDDPRMYHLFFGDGTGRYGSELKLATAGPEFAVDHPLDGERLSLPPFFEERRAEIEVLLKPLITLFAAMSAL